MRCGRPPGAALRTAKRLHFADDGDRNVSPVRRAPVFEQKNALPGAEVHFSINDRHCLARSRQCHFDVGWHIVAALGVVRKIIGTFGHKPIEELLQIASRGWISIFHDHDAATSVLDEHRHCTVSHAARVYLRLHIFGDLIQSFTVGAKFELVVMDMHQSAD